MIEKKKGGRRRDPNSKRSRKEDRHTMPRESFHLPEDLYQRFQSYLEESRPKPSKTAVLRDALDAYLVAQGV